MLPDFPEQKAKLYGHLFFYLRNRINFHLGFFAQVPRFTIPEGETARFVFADGSVDDMEMRQGSASFSVSNDAEPLNQEELLKQLDSLAQQLAEQQKKSLFETIEEATNKTGNVFSAKLSELGLNHFVDMLDKMWVDFNPDGTPRMPSIVVPPDVYQALKEREEKGLDADARKRMDEVMEEKRMEFLDRESRRRLVD